MTYVKKITVSTRVKVKDEGELWIHATEGDKNIAVKSPFDDDGDVYLDREQLVDWSNYYNEAVRALDEANRVAGKAQDL